MKKYEGIILGLLIAILVMLFFIFAFEATKHYSEFRQRHNEIQEQAKIEPWMSFSQVARMLYLPPEVLFSQLNITLATNPHLTLELYCKKSNENCSSLVDRINQLKER